MIRALIFLTVSVLGPATQIQAATWFCTAALVAHAHSRQQTEPNNAMPYSPTVLELDLSASGRFTAGGEDRFGGAVISFDWSGHWTDLDGRLALIGPKRTERNDVSEMRAFSTHVGQHELILDLTETAPFSQNMRCLTYDLS